MLTTRSPDILNEPPSEEWHRASFRFRIGHHKRLGFSAYLALLECLPRDVIFMIVSCLFELAPARNRIEYSYDSCFFFDVRAEIYVLGSDWWQYPSVYSTLDGTSRDDGECSHFRVQMPNIIQMASGEFHQLFHVAGEKGVSALYGLGSNKHGELGFPKLSLRLTTATLIEFFDPNKIGTINSIYCGRFHSVVWTTTGLYSFGCNTLGQLGHQNIDEKETKHMSDKEPFDRREKVQCGTPQDMLARVPEIQLSNIREVYVSGFNTFVLLLDGTIYGCGDNANGQLGLGYCSKRGISKLVKLIVSNVVHVAIGQSWVVFQTTTGLFACGDCVVGPKGIQILVCEDECPSTLSPKMIPFDRKVLRICAGARFLVVLTEEGDLYSCGNNRNYELGYRLRGLSDSHDVLTKIPLGNSKVVRVQCGSNNAIAVTADGKFYFWGFTFHTIDGIAQGKYEPQELPLYQELMKGSQSQRS